MTLESTINKNRYIGNGATTSFAFTFRAWNRGNVSVVVGDGLTESDVSASCDIELTVTGGTVTFPSAPSSGKVIVIKRSMPYIQEDDYRNGSRFDSEEVEDRFDMDCAERQDLLLGLERCIKMPWTSNMSPDSFLQLFVQMYNDIIAGLEHEGGLVFFDSARESLWCKPPMHIRDVTGITYPLPREEPNTQSSYNTVYASGSGLRDFNKTIKYCTAFGYGCGSAPIAWQYTDAIGGDAMIYAGYSDRNVAVGTETFCWGGAPDQQWLRTYMHDYWRKPTGNPYFPGEAGWDGGGLETYFPGVGQRLADFSDYATKPEDFSTNVAVGRDAGVHIVKGYGNVFLGYSAAAHLFSGYRNTAVGQLALERAVFANVCTAVGCLAGAANIDGEGNVFVGYASGMEVRGGSGCTIVGYNAARYATSADGAIVIGRNAGRETENLDDVIWIGNWVSQPAIAGLTEGYNKIGINLVPETIRCFFHVRYASSGSLLAPENGTMLIEGSSISGLTIETKEGGFGKINFATPNSNAEACISVNNENGRFAFVCKDKVILSIYQDGLKAGTVTSGNTEQDGVYSLGDSSHRWSSVFAASGNINTSDRREKDNIYSIDERVLSAWSSVDFKVFQFKDAMAKKGEKARIHVGVVAQDVDEAFSSNGLDASQYGLFCYDEWDDEYEDFEVIDNEEIRDKDGYVVSEPVTHTERRFIKKAGNRYGIRYEEALALECASLRWKINKLEQAIKSITGGSNG